MNNHCSLDRRKFGKLALSGALVGDMLISTPETIHAQGNKWSASGLKLGVSHQTLEMLNEMHFNYLKQMGVEYLEIRLPSAQISYREIKNIREKVENAGLKIFEIMIPAQYRPKGFVLGTPDRDKDITFFQNFIKDLGKAGIDCTTYGWLTTGAAYQTGTTITRGCRARLFELKEAQKMPNAYDREYSDEEMWDNYEYFIRQVLPVAEDAGVRLQLHPNDPPVTNQGVARIFRSTDAFLRAMEISNNSPYSGILFCVGSWAEMFGPDGKGEDIVKAIHKLGSQGHIYQVHLRNVSSPMPDFYETFPDNGYVNMYKVMKALGEVKFNGMVVPDHVPRCIDSEAGPKTGEAYIFGYIRALIQAVNTELESMS